MASLNQKAQSQNCILGKDRINGESSIDICTLCCCCSGAQSTLNRVWLSATLWRGLQHARPSCPSSSPKVCPSSGQSVQFSQSCLTLCDPINHSTPGLPVHHQLPEFTQTHVHRVGDAIQPSHPLSSPSPPAPNPFQHQGLFQWVN